MEYVFFAILLMVVFFYFRKQTKEKSKLGINLNAIYCPNCNQKQPILRLPKNVNQVLYGGNTCSNCKTEIDKYGKEVLK
jgi:hypothetical protein